MLRAINEGSELRVLLVEDGAALGLFLQKGLKLEGHDVDWVADGEAGLQRARGGRPDLIVLGLSLPKMGGTEVLAQMRGGFDGTAVLCVGGCRDCWVRFPLRYLGAKLFSPQ